MDNLVELHVHLEGAVRHETIYELLREKNLPVPGNGTLEDLKRHMIITEPKDLAHFLAPFVHIVSVIRDLKTAERVAYEFCEDMCRNKVKYVEARYAPHNFVPEQREQSDLSALEESIRSITRGFERGERDFGVKARSILCCLNGTDGVLDVLELSRKLRNEGVVGIDMATKQGVSITEEIILDPKAIYLYEEAKKCSIHRTIHAGESGGPDMIVRALDVFHAERIGHGYHAINDCQVYKRCLEQQIHFECCPWSSILTGAVPKCIKKHPIVRFAEDGAHFSINSDDPTVTGKWIQDDYKLAKYWGIDEHCLRKAKMNAAERCFLPEYERNELIQCIRD